MLSKAAIRHIHQAIDKLFDKVKHIYLGRRLPKDKVIAIEFLRDLSLPGLYESSAKANGTEPSTETLQTIVEIAESYLDAQKEKAKAQVVKDVVTFLDEARRADRETDVETALRGRLIETWGKVTDDVKTIVQSESQQGRSMGALEGILKINAMVGIEDPTVCFIVVRSAPRTGVGACDECMRLHMLPDRITPRVWKLSEVGSGYHKKGDPNPKVGGLHPNCLCSMVTLGPGWGFDAKGFLTYIDPDHDEFAKQRDIKP